MSLLLVERSDGLETKPIKTSYSPSAGTAYVTYDDVKVPAENLLGEENGGFKCIMLNFNHERWYIVAGANRAGVDSALVCWGIHAADVGVAPGSAAVPLDAARLAAFLAAFEPRDRPTFVLPAFRV